MLPLILDDGGWIEQRKGVFWRDGSDLWRHTGGGGTAVEEQNHGKQKVPWISVNVQSSLDFAQNLYLADVAHIELFEKTLAHVVLHPIGPVFG